MSIRDVKNAVLDELDALATAQGVAIAHEARNQEVKLPRIEVSAGPDFNQTLTTDGATRTTHTMQATIVTRHGSGTKEADALVDVLQAAFPPHSMWAGGRIKSLPSPGPAFKDQAERRQPVTLVLDIFS